MNLDTPTTLLVGATIAFAAAAVYASLGLRLLGRRSTGARGADRAMRLFSLWWLGVAMSTVTTGALTLLAAFGVAELPLFVTATYLNVLFICVALWGLLYYLLYLFTGRAGVIVPLSIFYVVYYALLVYYITASQPTGVEVQAWRARLTYAQPLEGPFFTVVLVFLVFPHIIGALAYLTLVFKVEDPTVRWRVSLVAGGILVWFGTAFIGAQSDLRYSDTFHLATRFVGLAAAFMVLLAYYPPRWVQRRFGVSPLRQGSDW